jgi:hypothetical protein
MKPDAPAEIRGVFRPIATSVPGTRICEHMPKLAQLAHRYTIVRTLSHDDVDHGSACYLALTGQVHPQKSSNPLPRPSDAPTIGAIVRRLRPESRLPYSAMHLNGPLLVPDVVGPGQNGGTLGNAFEPLQLGDLRDGASELHGLQPRDDLPPVRLDRRRSLLRNMEAYRQQLEDSGTLDMNIRRRQAYELLSRPESRAAFDLAREPAAVRDRYGRYRAGQACLLARRLVEAGVPYINVFFNASIRGQDFTPEDTEAYGWDTHNDIFDALELHLLPRFDHTFSVLLEDLRERGLLDSTLVVCMGEFGRAPRIALEKNFIGSTPGRKHWGACYSIVMAGAGVAQGKVLGASDRIAAYPVTVAYSPGDVTATMFHALGIDPREHYRDALDRPIQIATGKPIQGVY